ncbi:MAG: ferredoxin [Candidatus Doudnabacteria bacterium]|nr:ferredoxin [Candidatus Doudnabacteria bacterium]
MSDQERLIDHVEVDRSACIGAVVCEALAPGTFEIDDENIAVVRPKEGWDDDEAILDAAKACPVLAIKLMAQDGSQIFPEEDK